MKNIVKNFLTTPYPINTQNNGKIALITALFISFFILFFEPFGLVNLNIAHKKLVLAGYGLVSLIVLLINIVFLPHYFKNIFSENKWTIGKQIMFLLWILFCIGLGNYLYSNYIFQFGLFNLNILASFELFSIGIGIIPISIILLWKKNTLLKEHLKSAQELNLKVLNTIDKGVDKYTLLKFTSYNQKEYIEIPESNILFIESQGNYCLIYYLDKDKLKKKTLRTTLKSILNQLPENSGLMKSHRAFIINPEQINQIRGNAQGYRLSFNGTSKEAIVARSYIKEFKAIINKKNKT